MRTDPSHFGNVETVNKPIKAVLPVFFGKKDVCVVDESAFDVMKELNPQIGKELQVLATSVPLVDAVICVSRTYGDTKRAHSDMIRTLTNLHSEPAGRQILTLFKTSQLVPFKEKQLETVKKLWGTYKQFQKAELSEVTH